MKEKTFRIERVFNASVIDVWRAITEKELMKQWYFDLPEFKAEVGFKFGVTGCEEGGTQYLHHFEITEVILEKKLTHTWCFDGIEGVSYLTYELVDQGKKTLLILTHSGLENFPADHPDFAFHKFEEGWNHIVNTALKNFLEKENTSSKQNIMSNNKTNIVKDLKEKTILVSRTFNAPIALMWRAYTESELLDQWWGPSPWRAETKTMDFRVGGSWLYAMVGPQGEKHWAIMEYTEIDTLKKIGIIDAFSDEMGVINSAFPKSVGSFIFTENKEGVLIEFKMYYPTEKDIQTLVEMGLEQGISIGLDQLETLLDRLK